MRCANAKLAEFTGFSLREIADLSAILIFQKKAANHLCAAPVLRNGGGQSDRPDPVADERSEK
jgi:hypothetical protein